MAILVIVLTIWLICGVVAAPFILRDIAKTYGRITGEDIYSTLLAVLIGPVALLAVLKEWYTSFANWTIWERKP